MSERGMVSINVDALNLDFEFLNPSFLLCALDDGRLETGPPRVLSHGDDVLPGRCHSVETMPRKLAS